MGYSVYHIWCPLSSPQHLLLLYRRHRHTAGTHTIFFPPLISPLPANWQKRILHDGPQMVQKCGNTWFESAEA